MMMSGRNILLDVSVCGLILLTMSTVSRRSQCDRFEP